MSHHDNEEIQCPNCGYHATKNYCAQCGQPTHLHAETFWGLIMHFLGHYFHYDSKFWQTMKALWFSPGKLTLAYWNKQRARYLEPISLYIFISAVFFIVFAIAPNNAFKIYRTLNTDSVTVAHASASRSHVRSSLEHMQVNLDRTMGQDVTKDHESKEMREKFLHNVPKVFFFMIPVMGLILYLLFIKRKELNYAHHIIFAIHFHSFWFSANLARRLYVFDRGERVAIALVFAIAAIYFITALRNVYKISWARAIGYSLVTGFFYTICVSVAMAAVMIMLFR